MTIKRKPERTYRTKNKARLLIAVVPYIHGISHRLRKIAGKQGVQVVCSAPNMADSLCQNVNQEASNEGEVCDTAR